MRIDCSRLGRRSRSLVDRILQVRALVREVAIHGRNHLDRFVPHEFGDRDDIDAIEHGVGAKGMSN